MTWATYQDPCKASDAGRVLEVIMRHPGLPTWALARNAKMSAERVKHACHYLKRRGKAFAHRTEYRCPKTDTERVFACWFPGRKPGAVQLVDSSRCTVAMGYGRQCGTRLEERVTPFGRVVWACPACERRNRGVCRTCPRPTRAHTGDGPRPWFCATCLEARRKARKDARIGTPEYRAQKAASERARIERCRAAGVPYRKDRPHLADTSSAA